MTPAFSAVTMTFGSEGSATDDEGDIHVLKVIVSTKATTFGFMGQATMTESLEIWTPAKVKVDKKQEAVIEQDWIGTRDLVIRRMRKPETHI